eukprot:10342973-Alexandrium_andersonii.AAC.1
MTQMVASEAVAPEWDMREVEHMFTVSHTSGQSQLAILERLSELGWAERHRALPNASQWRLTLDGLKMLDAR